MQTAAMQYSTLFHCLYDHPDETGLGRTGFSVFRAIDCRDIDQNKSALPYVHDFAVIWDGDHDTRIISVLEEMLMAGMLPGVQFIGEHKGTLTVILAARTYWVIDVDAFQARLHKLTADAAGDFWTIEVGMYDHSVGNLRHAHQCDFKDIIGAGEWEHAFLFLVDSTWSLGTKRWVVADTPFERPVPGTLPKLPSRYEMPRRRDYSQPAFIPGLAPPPSPPTPIK